MTYHTDIKKTYSTKEIKDALNRELERSERKTKERTAKYDKKDIVYSWSEITTKTEPNPKLKMPKIEKAQSGYVKVKSKGVNDLRFITDDGSIIQLPIISATWNIEMGETPTITVVLAAEVDLDGCNIKMTKGKKTVPITDFIERKEEKHG